MQKQYKLATLGFGIVAAASLLTGCASDAGAVEVSYFEYPVETGITEPEEIEEVEETTPVVLIDSEVIGVWGGRMTSGFRAVEFSADGNGTFLWEMQVSADVEDAMGGLFSGDNFTTIPAGTSFTWSADGAMRDELGNSWRWAFHDNGDLGIYYYVATFSEATADASTLVEATHNEFTDYESLWYHTDTDSGIAQEFQAFTEEVRWVIQIGESDQRQALLINLGGNDWSSMSGGGLRGTTVSEYPIGGSNTRLDNWLLPAADGTKLLYQVPIFVNPPFSASAGRLFGPIE